MKCVSALSFIAITLLIGLIVYVWVEFGTNPLHRDPKNSTMHHGPNSTTTSTINQSTVKGKEFIEKTHLNSGDNIELIKPLKVEPPPLNTQDIIFDQLHNPNKEEKPPVNHHSGHFRHKSAEVWDPHPTYEIDAFGNKLILDLSYENRFVSPNFHIITHHGNYAEKVRHDPKMVACFYTGTVRGDPKSDVAVSLCHGMTGYIKTSKEIYHIEPAEKFSDDTIASILHRIERIQHTTSLDSNDIFDTLSEENVEHGSIVSDDLPEDHHGHIINKRDVHFDKLDTENAYAKLESITAYSDHHEFYHKNPDTFRTTRNADWRQNVTNEYHVEVLLVADESMVKYHKTEEDLKHYLMTLMNHVTHLYKHPSIGNAINISLVYIWILKHHFAYSNHAELLKKFCEWQEKYTGNKNHDVAVLITRNNLCSQNSNECRFLGAAQLGSMCQSTSCTIVADKGLSTSYTLAHELGHVLSMPHDSDNKCIDLNKGQTSMNIMNKIYNLDTEPWMWSKCSRHYLTQFLDTDQSKCLNNIPDYEIQSKGYYVLPGEEFDVNRQCELEFGEGTKVCSFMNSCRHLWCSKIETNNDKEGCRSQHLPWAEGTRCGFNKWCYHGECTSENRTVLIPIPGGWGQWQGWGPCSRSCGGGVKISIRDCNNPVPSNGGGFCTGKGTRYSSCNTHECDPKEPDFRALQCAKYDGNTMTVANLTGDVEWLPKYGLERPEDQCRLFCRPKKVSAYYLLGDKVKDGTKCGLTSFDICVNGNCRSAGCDHKLDSKLILDDCGVCGGDNSKCEKISGSYNRTHSGYNKVIRIPKGSSNIDIKQYSNRNVQDSNYLALVDGETGEYILNGGQQVITNADELIYGGLIIKYSGCNTSVERITTPKQYKLSKDLLVEVLIFESDIAPSISYSYYINRELAPRYGWRLYQKEWTKCDSICSGSQEMRPICVDIVSGRAVDDSNCLDVDKNNFIQRRSCNTHCQLTWNIVSRGPCSNYCGPGIREIMYNCMKVDVTQNGYSNRPVRDPEVVNDKHCSLTLSKPPLMEKCQGTCDNSARWEFEKWSECSKTCGGGYQVRTAKCVDYNGRDIDESQCKPEEKIIQKHCKTDKCPQWVASNRWSGCSVSCGRGYKSRQYMCHSNYRVVDDLYCDQSIKPYETKECLEKPCKLKWVTTSWNECTPFKPDCGDGIKRRHVMCEQDDEPVDDENCKEILRPNDTASCLIECLPDYDDYDNEIMGNSISYYEWRTGEWTQCSKSCDGGYQKRLVVCRDRGGSQVPNEYCNVHEQPNDETKCNSFACPKWNYGRWSLCDSNCEQIRQVSCRNSSGSFIRDEYCDTKKKPVLVQKCNVLKCRHLNDHYRHPKEHNYNRYKWKVGKWKPCNNHCGRGTRRRQVECKDTLNNVTLVDSFCNLQKKPKINQPCEQYNGHDCHAAWIIGNWSPCSKSCGDGIKYRNVTCHNVLADGVVNPEPIDIRQQKKDYCSLYNKPKASTKCLVSRCSDEFFWDTGPWTRCSNRCGLVEKQTRKLYCMHRPTNRRVGRKFCPRHLRPLRRRKCPKRPCLYRSCKEIKHYKNIRENKDYTILIGNKLAVVYCFKMDTSQPEEYITLKSTKNFAEFYEKRLSDLNSCPYGGQRRDDCDCDVINDRPGYTYFWKVRVNITTMRIEQNDFTFSSTTKGKSIHFGTAGDCYSNSLGCPQGQFAIDLSSTSFKISDNVRWIKRGTTATALINRDKTVIEGTCGGYCGECEPDPNIGLEVEIT